jgi:hypothetical protein
MLVRSWLVVRVRADGKLIRRSGQSMQRERRAAWTLPEPRTDICSGLMGKLLTLYCGSPSAEAPAAPSTSAVAPVIEIR